MPMQEPSPPPVQKPSNRFGRIGLALAIVPWAIALYLTAKPPG
jgi:hypothetical protein